MYKYITLEEAKEKFKDVINDNQNINDDVINQLIFKTSIEINEYSANNIETKITNNEIDITDLQSKTTAVIKDATLKLMDFYLLNGTINNDGTFSASVGSTSSGETRAYTDNKNKIKEEIINSFKAVNLLTTAQISSFNIGIPAKSNLFYEEQDPVVTHNQFWAKLKEHIRGIGGIKITQIDPNDIKKGININYELTLDPNFTGVATNYMKEQEIDLEEVIEGNIQDGITFKYDPNSEKYFINHNYNNNRPLRAELNRIIALIPVLSDYYNKKQTDSKISALKHNIEDMHKFLSNTYPVHSDLTSLGIKDSEFSAYGGNRDEKRFFIKALNYMWANNIRYFYLEVKLNNYSNLSIYFKKMLEDVNGPYRASGITPNGELRIYINAQHPTEVLNFIEITYKKDKDSQWISPIWSESYLNGNWQYDNRVTYENSYIPNFDIKLALDNDKTLIKDFDGNLVKFHVYVYHEILHHTIRMMLKQNATRLIVSSKGNTTSIDIPANKGRQWNKADGLREQKVLTTAPNQTAIQWNNDTKVAIIPKGVYDIFFKHILYDSGVGEKGARLAFFKADGETPAVLGTDYIVGNNFIQDEIFYDPTSAGTQRFKCGGIFQALKIIVLKPQMYWTRSTSRGSGLGHVQNVIRNTDQNKLSITRLDSGEEIENIGNES